MSNLAEIPTTITKPLQECVKVEGETVTLAAEVSKPKVQADWYKDDQGIEPDEKFEIKVDDTVQSLTIKDLTLEDEGEYTIEVPGDSSTAMVWVEGKFPPSSRAKRNQSSPQDQSSYSGHHPPSPSNLCLPHHPHCTVICVKTFGVPKGYFCLRLFLCMQWPLKTFGVRFLNGKAWFDLFLSWIYSTSPSLQVLPASRTAPVSIRSAYMWEQLPKQFPTLTIRWYQNNQASTCLTSRKHGKRHFSTFHVKEKRGKKRKKEHYTDVNESFGPFWVGNKAMAVIIIKEEEKWTVLAVFFLINQYKQRNPCPAQLPSAHLSLLAECPISITRPLEDVRAPEGGSVSLVCEVSSPHLPAKWFKDGQQVLPSAACVITQDGKLHTLTLPALLPEDAAQYVCKVASKSTTAKVTVEGRWCFFSILVAKGGWVFPEMLNAVSIKRWNGESGYVYTDAVVESTFKAFWVAVFVWETWFS